MKQNTALSIVVPTSNEAPLIRSFLRHLRKRAAEAEIILVDSGSSDDTREQARGFCDQLLTAPRGRATQMNAGAAAASGDTLWFLHADSEVPSDAVEQMAAALRDPKTVGGYFRIRLPRDRAVYRLTDSFAHYAGKVLRVRCGDHGFFCRRDVFEKIGGFPNLPLMEDVEFFRALCRTGQVRAVPSRLIASPRRYEEIGPTKLTLAYGLIATLYALGFPPRALEKLYARTCSTPIGPTSPSRDPAEVRSRSLYGGDTF